MHMRTIDVDINVNVNIDISNNVVDVDVPTVVLPPFSKTASWFDLFPRFCLFFFAACWGTIPMQGKQDPQS